jgi:hypothetical protein
VNIDCKLHFQLLWSHALKLQVLVRTIVFPFSRLRGCTDDTFCFSQISALM